MINNKEDLIFFISEDIKNMGLSKSLNNFLKYPIFRFVFLLRINEYLLNTKKNIFIRFLPLFWFRRLSIRLGFSIPLNVFDSGLAIVHYGLLIVNNDAKIGKNCRIHAGVNIGGAAGFKQKNDNKSYSPTIGDNCYIGPGAKLYGAIKIGNNCVIGANAVVNKDFIIDNVTIAGVPAKIISNKNSKGMILNGI